MYTKVSLRKLPTNIRKLLRKMFARVNQTLERCVRIAAETSLFSLAIFIFFSLNEKGRLCVKPYTKTSFIFLESSFKIGIYLLFDRILIGVSFDFFALLSFLYNGR